LVNQFSLTGHSYRAAVPDEHSMNIFLHIELVCIEDHYQMTPCSIDVQFSEHTCTNCPRECPHDWRKSWGTRQICRSSQSWGFFLMILRSECTNTLQTPATNGASICPAWPRALSRYRDYQNTTLDCCSLDTSPFNTKQRMMIIDHRQNVIPLDL